MTRAQVQNVCRHFGLIERTDDFCRLVIDGKVENREFGRFVRKAWSGQACFKMLRTVLCEPSARQFFDVFPKMIAEIDHAMAIANG